MVLSDAVLASIGTLAQVLEAMHAEGCTTYTTFTDIPVDSSLAVVNSIAALYRRQKCDSIIAVGGGSVIDTAKGVRLVLSQDTDDILALSGVESVTRGCYIPFIVVPTTAGTGSECTGVAVIRNDQNGVKMEFLSPFVEPDIAIIDPRMTTGLPPKATASTGMDALCHAIEACTCLQANPLSHAYGTAAIRLISENIIEATRHGSNAQARFSMAVASTMAGISFSNSMVGAVHAIGHAVGGVCHVPHAVAMAILLPHVMRYNLSHCGKQYANLLPWLVGMDRALAISGADRAQASIAAVESIERELHTICGLPLSLSSVGVLMSDLGKIARGAVDDGSLIVNPRSASVEQVEEILKNAM